MSLRSRRIDAEWELLESLAAANPHILTHIERCEGEFHVELKESPAWLGEIWSGENRSDTNSLRWVRWDHSMRYFFPRYYPTLPIEAFLAQPVLHPNVDPLNRFVCLWKTYSTAQTIVDAVVITRAVLSWSAVNNDPAHCMQSVQGLARLAMPELTIPDECRAPARPARARQRLEACEVDYVL
jgi:hypothetical protein